MVPDAIQSVKRALDILLYINAEGDEASITQIAKDMGIYKSTVYRTLSTMETMGFVQKNPKTEKYWLGSRLFILGKSVENKMGLQQMVLPYARKLHKTCREVVNVSVLDHSPGDVYRSIVILKEENPNQMLTVSPPVGSSSECHCSSVGKCLLAFSPGIDLGVYENQPLTVYTKYTITTVEDLRAELKKVRDVGYALDQEEQEVGLTCIGAPVLNRLGNAVAAISLSGPTSRMLSGNLEEHIRAVCSAAQAMSRLL